MAAEKDSDNGILSMLLAGSFLITFFHLYFYCYDSFYAAGINLAIFDSFLVKLNRSLHLFSNSLITKAASALLLGLYCFGKKSRKSLDVTWVQVRRQLLIGAVLFFGGGWLLRIGLPGGLRDMIYAGVTIAGFLMLLKGATAAGRIINYNPGKDPFNNEKEQFEMETQLMSNEDSVNIPILFVYKGKEQRGYVNVVNPYRASVVMGTPGSGKSFAIVNNFIRQHIEKGFTMYIYDYKFPDLSLIAYNYLQVNAQAYLDRYQKVPEFCIINFDNLRVSNRCNPLLPMLMTSMADAIESSKTIFLNMNKTWIKKEGDFFSESAVNFLAAIIWYLKRYDDQRLEAMGEQHDGKFFCTFPHAVEFSSGIYEEIFPVLQSNPEIESLMVPFASALAKEAYDQLVGQIASATIGLGRLSSPELYWVMTGNDFSLDINNPKEPKLLCVGNNPDRQKLYSAALGLYNARLVKIVNKKHKLPCSIIVDELPTIYFMGLDNLIATGRSNRVSTCLGLQDLSQLTRDYGKEEATAIFNTIGNVFSGQVKGETAKALSSSFGKNRQQSISLSENAQDTSFSVSDRMESMIPESKIANLSQGEFVGSVADNFGEEISQKVFKGKLVVEPEMVEFLKNLKPIPELLSSEQVSDEKLQEMVMENFYSVKRDIRGLLKEELGRIIADPELQHLVKQELWEKYA